MLYNTHKKLSNVLMKPVTGDVAAGRHFRVCEDLLALLIKTSVSQNRRVLALSLPNLVRDPISELKVVSDQPPFTLHFTPRAVSDYTPLEIPWKALLN